MDSSLPLPIIYSYRCTGCNSCVEVCPEHALENRNGKAVLAHPDICSYCTLCEDVCPTDAIALPFTVVFNENRDRRTSLPGYPLAS